jgi:hypothetical protein
MVAKDKKTPKTLVPEVPGKTFDYALLKLKADDLSLVMTKTEETKVLLKRTAENVIRVGLNLLAVKQVLPHGTWLPWLQVEFDMV